MPLHLIWPGAGWRHSRIARFRDYQDMVGGTPGQTTTTTRGTWRTRHSAVAWHLVYLASFDAQVFYGYYAFPGGSLFAKQEFSISDRCQIANATPSARRWPRFQRKVAPFTGPRSRYATPTGPKSCAWPDGRRAVRRSRSQPNERSPSNDVPWIPPRFVPRIGQPRRPAW